MSKILLLHWKRKNINSFKTYTINIGLTIKFDLWYQRLTNYRPLTIYLNSQLHYNWIIL